MAGMTAERRIQVRGAIRLGQFLKLSGAVDQGSDVKDLLVAGAVEVNGEPEDRRGRQLSPGDRVSVSGTVYRVVRFDHGS